MELKEYIELFRKEKKSFWITVVAVVLVGVFVFLFQPQTVKTTITVNVSRTGVQETQEYAYDGFYRLQADERFADTVVRWLQSPRVVKDIYSEARVAKERPIKGERLSSQVIRVRFISDAQEDAQKIATVTMLELKRQTENLNQFQQQKNWFVLLGDAPVIEDHTVSLRFILVLSLFLGLFLGMWTVAIRHYLKM